MAVASLGTACADGRTYPGTTLTRRRFVSRPPQIEEIPSLSWASPVRTDGRACSLGGELTPPYTPRRYLEAIEEFLAYGVDILVVDSFSHCWEGPGGVLEMADQAEE